MKSNARSQSVKSYSVFTVLFHILVLVFVVISVLAGVWALVSYTNGLKVPDSGNPIGVICGAEPSKSSRYAAHIIDRGSFIEPSHQLAIIQIILILVSIGMALGLIKYQGLQYRTGVVGSLVIILIIEVAMFTSFHSAVTLLCNG